MRLGWLERRLRRGLALPVGPPPQRYYPQCTACAGKQANAARLDRRTLVMHSLQGYPQPQHFAGAFGIARYNMHAVCPLHFVLMFALCTC